MLKFYEHLFYRTPPGECFYTLLFQDKIGNCDENSRWWHRRFTREKFCQLHCNIIRLEKSRLKKSILLKWSFLLSILKQLPTVSYHELMGWQLHCLKGKRQAEILISDNLKRSKFKRFQRLHTCTPIRELSVSSKFCN